MVVLPFVYFFVAFVLEHWTSTAFTTKTMASMRTATVAIHWFRKGLRLRDNPALLEACSSCSSVYPVFIIDPHFCKPDIVGINRYNFLLESLHDLDRSLRSLGSRLFVIRGKPEKTFPLLFRKWDVNLLTYEADTEPYSLLRDVKINELAASAGVTVSTHASHTLHDMEYYMSKCPNGNIPRSYGAFQKLFGLLSPPRKPVHTPEVVGAQRYSFTCRSIAIGPSCTRFSTLPSSRL